MDVNLRFRVTQAFATRTGFVGGVPTFYTAVYPDHTVFGALIVSKALAIWRDIPVPAFGRDDPVDFVSRVAAVMNYARKWSYDAGFPTFLQGVAGDTVYGAMLFNVGSVSFAWPELDAASEDIGDLFRAAQRYATDNGFVGAFPTFATKHGLGVDKDGNARVFHEVVLLPASTVRFVDIAQSDLDSPTLVDPPQHVRSMQRYAVGAGGIGAIPTFFVGRKGGFVCGTLLLNAAAAEWRDVTVGELGTPDPADQAARFRAVQGYADTHGFVGGFPTFLEATHEGEAGPETVYGTVFVKENVAEKRDVVAGDLGNPPDDDGPARFRATQDYAVRRANTTGGFPNFNELPLGPNRENVYGTLLLRNVVFRDVSYEDLFTDDVIGGAIRTHWLALGGPTGFLGLPLTEELPCIDGVGGHNRFDGGVIFWSPTTGAWEVHGAILDRWGALGFERSYLGYPQSDENALTDPLTGKTIRYSRFERGTIFWSDGVVFELPDSVTRHFAVTTPAGSPLGGSVDITLRSDGSYRLTMHMHASGFDSFDFSVRPTYTTPRGFMLGDQAEGHVQGTLGSGSRNFDRTIEGNNILISLYWNDFSSPASRFNVAKEYSATGAIGFVLGVTKVIVEGVAAGVGAGVGAVIGLGKDIGALFPSLGIGETFGIIDGAVVFAFGGGLAMAIAEGIAVGAIMDAAIASRKLKDAERTFAKTVFGDKLTLDNIRVTNLSRPDGRAFTIPGIDGLTYVNMGVDREDYSQYVRPGRNPADMPGQLLIHELTHAWQIEHRTFEPLFICTAAVSGADDLMGQDVYTEGPPGADWTAYLIEQQAMIVENWFARGSQVNDPYFQYIRDNIRQGNA